MRKRKIETIIINGKEVKVGIDKSGQVYFLEYPVLEVKKNSESCQL